MIRINCFFQVKEGRRAEALAAAKALTAVSLQQEGCIAYDIFESATRPEVLLICETWQDEKTLMAHSESEPFFKHIAVLNETCSVKVERFNF